MENLEVSGAVRPLYGSLGVKGLIHEAPYSSTDTTGMTHIRNVQSVLDLPAAAGCHTVRHDHPVVVVVFLSVGSPCCYLQLQVSCKSLGLGVGVGVLGGTAAPGAALAAQGTVSLCCGSLRLPRRPHLQLVPGTHVAMCPRHPGISLRRIA